MQSVFHTLLILIKPFTQDLLPLWEITDKYQKKCPNYLISQLHDTLMEKESLMNQIFIELDNPENPLMATDPNTIDKIKQLFVQISIKLICLLITDSPDLIVIDNWEQDLKSCLKIVEPFTSKENITSLNIIIQIKRFEFIGKLSRSFTSVANQRQFKGVVARYFMQDGELIQFKLEEFTNIKTQLQQLIDDQVMRDLLPLMLLETSFLDEKYRVKKSQGKFLKIILKPALSEINSIMQR